MIHRAVTTFSPDGYRAYAHRLIETFDRYWPGDVELHAYVDEPPDALTSPRIKYLPIPAACVAFKARHRDNPAATGRGRPGIYDYRYDAVRFSHKVYAWADAALVDDPPDRLYWLDGDTVTHAPVTKAWLERLLPDQAYTSFLGRGSIYTETGFLGFAPKHPANRDFMLELLGLYESGAIFKLREWHDCMAYDAVRERFVREGRIRTFNLTPPGLTHHHPLIHSVLAECLDHAKGDRKRAGRTSRNELLRPRTEAHWQG